MPPKRVAKKKVNRNVAIPSNTEELEQVLQGFLTPDTNVTAKALEVLKVFLDIPQCVPALFSTMTRSVNPSHRQLSAVLLYKKIKKHWRAIPETGKAACREAILERLVIEENVEVSRSITALACIIARVELPKGRWPTLLTWVWEASNSQNATHRETCLRILRSLVEYCSEIMEPHFAQLRKLFEGFLLDSHKSIRQRAVSALSSLFAAYKTIEDAVTVKDCIPTLLNVMKISLEQDDDDCLAACFEMFSIIREIEEEIADHQAPDTFYISELIPMVVNVVVDPDMTMSTRNQAVSFIEEYVKSRPGVFTQYNFVTPCLDGIVKCLVEPEEEPFDTSEATAQRIGVTILEVFLQYLPRLEIVTKLIAFFNASHNNPDEHVRKACYVAISCMIELASDVYWDLEFGRYVKELVATICNKLPTETSSLVVTSMCICLTHICHEFDEDFTEYQNILPLLLTMLESNVQNDNVRNYLLSSLDYCCEQMRSNIVSYLPRIMSLLDKQLQSADIRVVETAVTAIATVALSAESEFLPYFPAVYACVLKYLDVPKVKENQELVCKTVCCLGSMARAVGKDHWGTEVQALTENVIKLYNNHDDDCDYREACITFLGDVISALRLDAPQNLVELTLRYCCEVIRSLDGLHMEENEELESNLAGLSDDDDDDDVPPQEGEEDDEFNNRVDSVTMDVGELDCKLAAFTTLNEMILALGPKFEPYINDYELAISETIHFPFEQIVKYAVISYSKLLEMLHATYPTEVVKGVNTPINPTILPIVNKIMTTYMEVLASEGASIVSTVVCEINANFSRFGMALIAEDSETFTRIIFDLVKEEGGCQVRSEFNDVQSEGNLEVLDSVCDLLGTMSEYMGEIFKPFFAQCLPYLLKFCTDERPNTFRSMAIGLLGEILDNLGECCGEYVDLLFPVAIQYLDDSSVSVRSHAAYLASSVAAAAGTKAAPYLEQACGKLNGLIVPVAQRANVDTMIVSCNDNVVSCLARFVECGAENVPVAEIIPLVINSMPLTYDMVENSRVLKNMVSWFKTHSNHIIPLIPQVVNIFAVSWKDGVVLQDVHEQMVELMKYLITTYGADKIVAPLPQDLQETLHRILNPQ